MHLLLKPWWESHPLFWPQHKKRQQGRSQSITGSLSLVNSNIHFDLLWPCCRCDPLMSYCNTDVGDMSKFSQITCFSLFWFVLQSPSFKLLSPDETKSLSSISVLWRLNHDLKTGSTIHGKKVSRVTCGGGAVKSKIGWKNKWCCFEFRIASTALLNLSVTLADITHTRTRTQTNKWWLSSGRSTGTQRYADSLCVGLEELIYCRIEEGLVGITSPLVWDRFSCQYMWLTTLLPTGHSQRTDVSCFYSGWTNRGVMDGRGRTGRWND